MAARGGVQAPRLPVTLRDFLEFGCDSSSDGFRSYPRRPPLVRPDTADAVLQQQQQAPPAPTAAAPQLLRRSPSRSASSLSLSLLSSLSRSFSRRIKEGFWRRRDDDEEAAYFDDRESCGFPSPLVSSCSASVSDESEYGAESEAGVTTTTTTEETTPASERDKQATASTTSSSSSSSTSSSADHGCTDDAAAAADAKKVQPVADGDSALGRKKAMDSMVEDKQQQSPVSVLDFPFDDDDGEEEGSDAGTRSSPAFQFQRFTPPPDLHGTKHQQQVQLLHKFGRYDGGGVAQGIDPVDLDARFTAATSESGESGDASTRLATTTSGSSTDSSSSTETTATRHDDDDAEHQSAERSPSPHHHQEQEESDDEYRLLARLLEHDAAAAACLDDEVSRVLVLDFFAEGTDRLVIRSSAGRRQLDDDRSEAAAEALVETAAEWLRGSGPQWGIADVVFSGKAGLDDMERSRRWMCVGEEQRDIGADVEGDVVNALLDELVTELGAVLPWWPRGDMAVDEPGCARSLTEC